MREDWIECKIGELFEVVTGSTPPKNNEEFYSSNDYPFYKPTDLNAGINVTQSLDYLSNSGFVNSRNAPAKSVLVTCIGATIGKAGLISNSGSFNQQINAVLPNTVCESIFTYYQITSVKFQKELIRNSSSTTLPIINKSRFNDLNFSLPPLPEQRAIVKKLESLFSSLDAGVADLKKAQQQLKIYRQAVLKKAFEGELTKEEIEYKTIGEIGKVKGGKRLPKGHNYVEHSPYPYLRVTDFNNLTIDTSSLKYISKETHQLISRYTISKDDVFISIAGTIGQVGIIPDHLENANLTENAAKITELKDVNNKYLAYYLSSSLAKNQITEKTMATTQPKLALFRIENIIFPYYSIIKQHQIVKQIESRLSVCDSIEENIKESLEKAEALRQSILKKAFEGNLLTEQELAACRQAPDYEPASVLLERIQAAQTDLKTKPAKKKVVR